MLLYLFYSIKNLLLKYYVKLTDKKVIVTIIII